MKEFKKYLGRVPKIKKLKNTEPGKYIYRFLLNSLVKMMLILYKLTCQNNNFFKKEYC